jgi:hypothetical protein
VVQLSSTTAKMVPSATASVTIRMAGTEDTRALHRLAALDSTIYDGRPALVAEVDGELWAAVSLESDATMADPFRPSAELLLLLAERSRQLRAVDRARGGRRRAFAWRTRRASPVT